MRSRVTLVLILSCLVQALAGCSLFRPAFPDVIPVHHARASSGTLRAGSAVVDITPPAGRRLFLAGYSPMRKSEGVHDPLRARALVLSKGDLTTALVTVDLIGLQHQTIAELKKRIEILDSRHVLVSATHSHGGPDTLGLWGFPPIVSGLDDEYLQQVLEGIVRAIDLAHFDLRPAEIAWGTVIAPERGLLRNRRRPGLVDREIVVVHVRASNDESTIATLTGLGCHAVAVGRANKLITADFPHFVTTRIEEHLGGTAIFLPGAVGGHVVPDVDVDVEDTTSRIEDGWGNARRIGAQLADLSLAVVERLDRYSNEPELALWHTPLFLKSDNFRYDLARWTELLDRDLYDGGYLKTEVNLWRIGSLQIASIPGEITPDLALRIKDRPDGGTTMIVGLANDQLGYLLPSADFDLPLHSYERILCPGRSAGDRVVRRLRDLTLLADQEFRTPISGRE